MCPEKLLLCMGPPSGLMEGNNHFSFNFGISRSGHVFISKFAEFDIKLLERDQIFYI